MQRFFTTEVPVNCTKHYCLPPLERFNLNEILALITQEKYFLLHALRQTGKTSCLSRRGADAAQGRNGRCRRPRRRAVHG
jgi:hypothetical protein